MPDVISNTTPLRYLHQIGCLDLLTQFYQQVFVPQMVVDELRQGELRGIDVPSLNALAWVTVDPVSPIISRSVQSRFFYIPQVSLTLQQLCGLP